MAQRTYNCEFGLIEQHRAGVAPLQEVILGKGEFQAGSLGAAQREATRLAKENEELLKRFGYESPHWTDTYTIMEETQNGKLEGRTRQFRRDVQRTGKLGYIHLTWYAED